MDERAFFPPPEQQNPLKATERSEIYGSKLLLTLVSAAKEKQISSLVIPVVIMHVPSHAARADILKTAKAAEGDLFNHCSTHLAATISIPIEQQLAVPYIDIGAVDVIPNPIKAERLPNLAIHIYRTYKEYIHSKQLLAQITQARKRSWVGLGDTKPYAYLREAMVGGLMDGICSLNSETFATPNVYITVEPEREEVLVEALASWGFSAHEFSDDELLFGAGMMLQHALDMEELKDWRIPTDQLHTFLAACRSAYNSFVPYHNFRHVIDVLQAVFYFLVKLETLPPFPPPSFNGSTPETHSPCPSPKPPIPALLGPFDALTLLITAIGHDVGHPGVNNAFLVTLNAPLAQLYNDRSVLESFHCAAYSQILRRHWPSVFGGIDMRQLMISSILATDMGLHFDYMKKLGWLQERLHEFKNSGVPGEGWNGRLQQEYRTLACSLLIKCADISNVARPFPTALRWTHILTDEFSRQACMEGDLGIPTALFAPPVRETIELGQSQIGFINIFAYPLFHGVADVMPNMAFVIEEMLTNKRVWEEKIGAEQVRLRASKGVGRRGRKDRRDSDGGDGGGHERHRDLDGIYSPRQLSFASSRGASVSKASGETRHGSGTEHNGSGSANTSQHHSTVPTTVSNLRHDSNADTSPPDDGNVAPVLTGRDLPMNPLVKEDTRGEAKMGGEPTSQLATRVPSGFDTPAPNEEDERPYESSTIPIGHLEMENPERQAEGRERSVHGILQRNNAHASSGVLEFPRHVSRGQTSSRRSRPPTGGSDGQEDWAMAEKVLNGKQASNRNSVQPDGLLSVPGPSNGHSNGRLDLKSATSSPDLRIKKVTSPLAKRSRPETSHHGSVDNLAGKHGNLGVHVTVEGGNGEVKKSGLMEGMKRSLTRKKSSSRNFRFWRKRPNAGVEETPAMPVVGSERSSGLSGGAQIVL